MLTETAHYQVTQRDRWCRHALVCG